MGHREHSVRVMARTRLVASARAVSDRNPTSNFARFPASVPMVRCLMGTNQSAVTGTRSCLEPNPSALENSAPESRVKFFTSGKEVPLDGVGFVSAFSGGTCAEQRSAPPLRAMTATCFPAHCSPLPTSARSVSLASGAVARTPSITTTTSEPKGSAVLLSSCVERTRSVSAPLSTSPRPPRAQMHDAPPATREVRETISVSTGGTWAPAVGIPLIVEAPRRHHATRLVARHTSPSRITSLPRLVHRQEHCAVGSTIGRTHADEFPRELASVEPMELPDFRGGWPCRGPRQARRRCEWAFGDG